MNLNRELRKALVLPNNEERSFAAQALSELKSLSQRGVIGAVILLFLTVLFYASLVSHHDPNSWVFLVMFLTSLVISLTLILQTATEIKLIHSISGGDFRVLHGHCHKSMEISAGNYDVFAVINECDSHVIFNLPSDVVRKLPPHSWPFLIVANDWRAVILIQTPQAEIYVATELYKWYPYSEEV